VIAGGLVRRSYTTLCALTFPPATRFKGRSQYYGVGLLRALAEDTHKFGSRYIWMVGGAYPEQSLYDAIADPLAVRSSRVPVDLQGDEDKIIAAANQEEAEMMSQRRCERQKVFQLPMCCLKGQAWLS
jgi:hypothetical protein